VVGRRDMGDSYRGWENPATQEAETAKLVPGVSASREERSSAPVTSNSYHPNQPRAALLGVRR
jgi:hypothetical protein